MRRPDTTRTQLSGGRSPILVLLLLLLLLPWQTDAQSDLNAAQRSKVRHGYTGVRLTSLGCMMCSLGAQTVTLFPDFTQNSLILFGKTPESHAQVSPSFDKSRQTDILWLGTVSIPTVINFSYPVTNQCGGIFPLGAFSPIWPLFAYQLTMTGDYILFGTPQLPQTFNVTTIKLSSGHEHLPVTIDLGEQDVQVPLQTYLGEIQPAIVSPFYQLLPPTLYEPNDGGTQVVLGRAYLLVGVIHLNQPVPTIETLEAFYQSAQPGPGPNISLTHATGLESSLITQKFFFAVAIIMVILLACWDINEMGTWQKIRAGLLEEVNLTSLTEFFPDCWVHREEEMMRSAGGMEWPLTWLFLFALIMLSMCMALLKNNRLQSLQILVAWTLSENPWLPTDLVGVCQLLVFIHLALTAAACCLLPLILALMELKEGSVVLVPAIQFGFLTAWCLVTPGASEPLALTTWMTLTIFWNWHVVWDMITVAHFRDASRFFVWPMLLDGVAMIFCSCVLVFTPVFAFHGPADISLYPVWITVFVGLIVIPPLFLKSLIVSWRV